jgi:hypothetical protein
MGFLIMGVIGYIVKLSTSCLSLFTISTSSLGEVGGRVARVRGAAHRRE